MVLNVEASRSNPFGYCSKDVVLHIFSYCNDKRYLGIIACVCKDWNRLSQDDHLWKRLIPQQLSIKLTNLPECLLKAEFKSYWIAQKAKVDLYLKHQDKKFVINDRDINDTEIFLFSKELIAFITSEQYSVLEKAEKIKKYSELAGPIFYLALLELYKSEDLSVLSLLLELGANPNAMLSGMEPALIVALSCQQPFKVIKLLLQYGADKATINEQNQTAHDVYYQQFIPKIMDIKVLTKHQFFAPALIEAFQLNAENFALALDKLTLRVKNLLKEADNDTLISTDERMALEQEKEREAIEGRLKIIEQFKQFNKVDKDQIFEFWQIWVETWMENQLSDFQSCIDLHKMLKPNNAINN